MSNNNLNSIRNHTQEGRKSNRLSETIERQKIRLVTFDVNSTIGNIPLPILCEIINKTLRDIKSDITIEEGEAKKHSSRFCRSIFQEIFSSRGITQELPDDLEETYKKNLLEGMSSYKEKSKEFSYLYRGTREMLEGIIVMGVKVAIVTNNFKDVIIEMLKSSGMSEKIIEEIDIVGIEEVKNIGKPDPRGIQLAMSNFKEKHKGDSSGELQVSEVLHVGDSLPDVLAARGTGVNSIVIGDGEKTGEDKLNSVHTFSAKNNVENTVTNVRHLLAVIDAINNKESNF